MKRKKSLPIVFQGMEAGLKMFRWVVLVLFVLFWFSGIQEVEKSNVGLLLRFGQLQGVSLADQVHQPGLLLALPFPIDEVLQVPVAEEGEVTIDEVFKDITDVATLDKIDPTKEGYCLTGDQNIIQAKMVVKYRISDPIAFRLRMADPEGVLHEVVLASLTQTIAGWHVDDVLRLQRDTPQSPGTKESLAATVRQRAQQRLDLLECGMTISAFEFKQINPPRHVIAEFRAVQSAKIEMETKKRQAEGFAGSEIPKAEAQRDRLIKQAQQYENLLKAQATAEYRIFEQLYEEYRKSPGLVRQRLYQETVEEVYDNVGKLRFVSPAAPLIISDVEVQP